jgi:hypothetical protein
MPIRFIDEIVIELCSVPIQILGWEIEGMLTVAISGGKPTFLT